MVRRRVSEKGYLGQREVEKQSDDPQSYSKDIEEISEGGYLILLGKETLID